MARLVVQAEAGSLVDPPGVGEYVVGPQRDAGVPAPAGEPEHLLHQPGADPEAPGPRLHEQHPQLGRAVVLPHAEHAARRSAVDLGDPGSLATEVPVVYVIGDDPGHERLERLVPAELLRVQRPVPLHHPAHVARLGRPQQVPARLRGLRQHVGDHVHGVQQPAPVIVVHRGQHVPGPRGRPGVQARHHRTPVFRQRDDLAAPVGRRAPPGDEAAGGESGQDAAQVPRVDVDRAPQIGHLAGVALRQLEQDPRLGERVRRVQVLAAQQPDHVRVEPVERPHRRHRPVPRRPAACRPVPARPAACRPVPARPAACRPVPARPAARSHQIICRQFAHGIPRNRCLSQSYTCP